MPKAGKTFRNQFPELDPLVAQILYNRGIVTQEKIDEFLSPDYGKYVHDPFLLSGMDKAVERIMKAIIGKENIMVYGDYDADGVCATVVLVSILRELGIKPHVHIPFRESEGYGLNIKVVDEVSEKHITLIITVDCGIANVREIEALQKIGADVVVTDHHNPQDVLPAAYALINPKLDEKYPTKEICGTGVAYKLAQAMLSEKIREKYKDELKFPSIGFEKWLLDLVAIGTVADMVEVIGESRTLVKYGMIVLKKTRRLGLLALMKASKIDIHKLNTFSIGFQIGPRLNAAGRMGHAITSYELLITNDNVEAQNLALDLNEKNQKRQKMSNVMYLGAMKQTAGHESDPVVFAKDDAWSPPLVGLVAGKVCEDLYRPCVVIGKNNEGKIVGSGRSIDGFDITWALGECKEFLSRYGGHAKACGFTLKEDGMYENFKKKMFSLANKSLHGKNLTPEFIIDTKAELVDINWEFMETMEKLEPYGQGNSEPKFLVQNCKLVSLNTVGASSSHLKGSVSDGDKIQRQIIGFSMIEWCKKLKVGDMLDIVCIPLINQWNGNREIQLKIVDLRLSDSELRITD